MASGVRNLNCAVPEKTSESAPSSTLQGPRPGGFGIILRAEFDCDGETGRRARRRRFSRGSGGRSPPGEDA
eukprot:14241216-Alexandrium_andersonii.AAC.1